MLDTPDADQRIEDFENTISDINTLEPQPDLIIHSGDVVQNGRLDEYAIASSVLAKARAPTYVMVGNKDDRQNLRTEFSSAEYLVLDSEFITYSIEGFPIKLIVLDTLNPGSNKGDFCKNRIASLNRMIEAETTRPVAVFAHHPPFLVPEGPEPLHFETSDIMNQFCQTLCQIDRICGIFCGHVHRSVPGLVRDIPVSVVSCIATTLRRGDYPPHMKTRPVYHIHRFDDVNGFTTESRIVV